MHMLSQDCLILVGVHWLGIAECLQANRCPNTSEIEVLIQSSFVKGNV